MTDKEKEIQESKERIIKMLDDLDEKYPIDPLQPLANESIRARETKKIHKYINEEINRINNKYK